MDKPPGNSDAGLAEELRALRELVGKQSRRDDMQQRAFDQLYEELRQYKDDFIFQAEKPLLLDLLLFYDSLTWFQQSMIDKEMSPDVIADSFQYLIDEFLELLYRRDVTPLEAQRSFERSTQKAIKVLPTDDPEKDWRVEHVTKRGFTRGGRLLRPDEVVLHRFRRGEGSGGGSD
jgi:molecular chaperone GrpE (heat shock protein)